MGSKECKKCKLDRPLEDYYLSKKAKDGRESSCKSCRVASRGAYDKEYHRKYREQNKIKRKIADQRFREENPDYFREWRKNNPDKCYAYRWEYRRENMDALKVKAKERYLLDPSRYRKYTSDYRARKLNATPAWLTEDQKSHIADIYYHARDCEVVSGEKYEVDHIVPLKGENICGLHVPWNLQVLPQSLNRRKNNKV